MALTSGDSGNSDSQPPEAAAPHALMPVVVGAPRSGTTLLRFMLDSHPALAIPPETGFLRLGPELIRKGVSADEFHRAIVNFPESYPAWDDFGLAKDEFRTALARLEPFTVADGFRTFYRLYAQRSKKKRWGDKTPLHGKSMNGIREVLPEARFIHIIRDGRDVALSLREMWFSPGTEMAVQAAHWRDWVNAAREAGLGRSDYLEVRYESLVRQPQAELEKICSFIDIGFAPDMLNYQHRASTRLKEHKTRYRADGSILVTHERRLEQMRLTTRPPDTSRVSGWKTAMTLEDRERFEAIAGNLLHELGYEI